MKKLIFTLLFASSIFSLSAQGYQPSEEVRRSQEQFSEDRFGIFIHWGIYSMYAQGEWYLQNAQGIQRDEYAKAADAFYPHRFDAEKWVAAIKASGAKYVCFTTRHHDSFSMWDTAESAFDIVDATPFKRDVLKELTDECHKQGIAVHLYYSHADWSRDDYPRGRTGWGVAGRDYTKISWDSYFSFMNNQIAELLTNYGPIRAMWFDGWWDHEEDATPFDWHLDEQYALVHNLQPSCMVANNHHVTPFEGEDIQIFERDLPGENSHGLSGQAISKLPLETCQTMNGMWGYKVVDQNYKSAKTLIRYLVSTASKGANLLLNVGPQPNGELPAVAVERMYEMGEWMAVNGASVYGTTAGDIPQQDWGCTTRKDDSLFVHVFELNYDMLYLPLECKVVSATALADGKPVKFQRVKGGILLEVGKVQDQADYVVELVTK